MKKSIIFSLIAMFSFCVASVFAFAPDFSESIKTCQPYSNTGRVSHEGIYFNLKITLEKSAKNKCLYQEKIYQGDDYHMITCEFVEEQLSYLSQSMASYKQHYDQQIQQTPIFEAKMTSNGEILNKFLADPKICKITHSKNRVKI